MTPQTTRSRLAKWENLTNCADAYYNDKQYETSAFFHKAALASLGQTEVLHQSTSEMTKSLITITYLNLARVYTAMRNTEYANELFENARLMQPALNLLGKRPHTL
ncbi:MAG: hypothetical protein CSB47_01795 [Proteobacteria bacterium]|nr:MAG: hypothetical protein CSB47_01795 [Pseudomonadota bacterium]